MLSYSKILSPLLLPQTREFNFQRMYEQSAKYSKLVLICDSLALVEHGVVIVAAVTVLIVIYVYKIELFQ